MKKIIKSVMCILSSAALIFSGISALADKAVGNYTYKYFTYNINSDDTITLISCDSSVTSVSIPDEINSMPVSDINGSTFQNCNSLKKITVSTDNKYFSVSTDGILMNKAQTKLIKCPTSLNISSYTIPSYVTAIAPYCFENSIRLEFVSIPESVTTIGKCAFKGTSFTNITLANSSVSIGSEALGYSSSEKISDFTLYGFQGSSAEKYAADNGFTFIPVDNDSFNISVNGNLYFYNDDKSFSNKNIVITNKSGNSIGYSFSSTPTNVFENYKSASTQINILSVFDNIITSVNVRVAMAGDANIDGKQNVRDAAFIASSLAKGKKFTGFQNMCADKNKDGKTDVIDAASIARELAARK